MSCVQFQLVLSMHKFTKQYRIPGKSEAAVIDWRWSKESRLPGLWTG